MNQVVNVRERRAAVAGASPRAMVFGNSSTLDQWTINAAASTGLPGIVHAALTAIANDISAVPFRAGFDPTNPTKYNLAAPLGRLVGPEPGSPNPAMRSRVWWRTVVERYIRHGVIALEVDRNAAGQIAALWPIEPDRVRPIFASSGLAYFAGFRVQSNSKEVIFPPEKLIYLHRPDPADLHRPLSLLQQARLDVAALSSIDVNSPNESSTSST